RGKQRGPGRSGAMQPPTARSRESACTAGAAFGPGFEERLQQEARMAGKMAIPDKYHQKLQEIISGSNEGIILLKAGRGIVWANPAALAMHGASRLSELGATGPEYRKRYVLAYRNHRLLTARQYPIERLLAKEKFSGVVVRVTRRGRDDGFCRYHA